MYFCVVLCIVRFVSLVCICELYYRHWVATQMQLNISYHIFLTCALDGGEELTPRPSLFTAGKEHRYPLNRKVSGPQSGLDSLE